MNLKKISNKLLLISAVLLLIITGAFGFWSSYKANEVLNEKLNLTLKILSNTNKKLIMNKDNIALDMLSREFTLDNDISRIIYYDKKGEIISSHVKNQNNYRIKKQIIKDGDKTLGSIEIAVSVERMYTSIVETIIFLILFLLFLFFLFHRVIAKIILQPIEKLIVVANEVSKGNYDSRIQSKNNDEFEFLSKIFNSMLDEIEKEQEELYIEIDKKKKTEKKLRESEKRLEKAQEIAQLGNWEYNLNSKEMTWSTEVYRIFGYKNQDININLESFYQFVHEEDKTLLRAAIESTLKNGDNYSIDYRIIDIQGNPRYVHSEGEIIHNEEGSPSKFIGIIQDISRAKESEEKLNYLAFHDTLTGLPNRLLFLDRLKEAIIKAEREKKLIALFFLDLDRFKIINDTLGHNVGDELLKLVSERLKSVMRKSDTISRLGGDEFTVLLSDIESYSSIITIAEKIIKVMEKEFTLLDHEFYVSTSIGIACYPHDGETGELLLKNADIAMYQAKSLGGNRYYFYSDTFTELSLTKLKLETKFRQAIEKNEFVLYYQPQYCLQNGELIGMEVLTYWNHQGEIIGPGEFIPLAEETGLIVAIGEWVMYNACVQIKSWQDKGYKKIPVAVNISAVQFSETKLLKTINKVLSDTGLHPDYLELELTESLLMNAEKILPYLNAIRDMGIRISIDDFGTGFSSLSYLRLFPIDKLKIDRSFVSDLSNKDNNVITNAIINLGQSLKLKIIAEGVETEEQAEALKGLGCEEVQGYLYGRPVIAEHFINHFSGENT